MNFILYLHPLQVVLIYLLPHNHIIKELQRVTQHSLEIIHIRNRNPLALILRISLLQLIQESSKGGCMGSRQSLRCAFLEPFKLLETVACVLWQRLECIQVVIDFDEQLIVGCCECSVQACSLLILNLLAHAV